MVNIKKILVFCICFCLFGLKINATNTSVSSYEQQCDNNEFLCVTCTYEYNGLYTSVLNTNKLSYYLFADGTGGGKLEVELMSATENINWRTSLKVNNLLVFNDFINEEKTNIKCPNIAYDLSFVSKADDEDSGDYVLDFFLPNNNTSSDHILKPTESTNNKKFEDNVNGNDKSTSKKCYLMNEEGNYSLKLEYDAIKEKAILISDDVINKSGITAADKKLYGGKNCNDIFLYYKRSKLPDSDTGDDYIVNISEVRKSGYEKLYGIDEITDQDKIKDNLQESVEKNKNKISVIDYGSPLTNDQYVFSGILTCEGLFGGTNSETRKILSIY